MKQAQIRRKHAFTLIELLVVISIIALLVSILMPALGKAKEMARMTVCLSNCKQAGTALQMYTSENEDWLPGPNTSGLKIGGGDLSSVDSSSRAPVQNMDWMSPLMGRMLSLPENRVDRFIQLSNHDFSCPSNREYYDYEYGGTLIPDVQAVKQVSYSASLAFLTYSANSSKGSPYVTDSEYGNGMVPDNYAPKINKVGRPSEKVFMMEGSRYLSTADMRISLNAINFQNDGGNYAMYGPATPIVSSSGGDPFRIDVQAVGTGVWEATLQEGTEKYAFRHSNNRMNLTYFDGHAESSTFEESLDVHRYWPKGSTIVNGNSTKDPMVQAKSNFRIR